MRIQLNNGMLLPAAIVAGVIAGANIRWPSMADLEPGLTRLGDDMARATASLAFEFAGAAAFVIDALPRASALEQGLTGTAGDHLWPLGLAAAAILALVGTGIRRRRAAPAMRRGGHRVQRGRAAARPALRAAPRTAGLAGKRVAEARALAWAGHASGEVARATALSRDAVDLLDRVVIRPDGIAGDRKKLPPSMPATRRQRRAPGLLETTVRQAFRAAMKPAGGGHAYCPPGYRLSGSTVQ